MRAEDFFQPVQGRSGTMQASVAQKIDDIVAGAKIERKKRRVRKAVEASAGIVEIDPSKSAQILDAQRGLMRSAAGWWENVPEDTQELVLNALAGLHLGTVSMGEYRAAFDAVKREALGPVRPSLSYNPSNSPWGYPPCGGW